jgi:hypothetical protein
MASDCCPELARRRGVASRLWQVGCEGVEDGVKGWRMVCEGDDRIERPITTRHLARPSSVGGREFVGLVSCGVGYAAFVSVRIALILLA